MVSIPSSHSSAAFHAHLLCPGTALHKITMEERVIRQRNAHIDTGLGKSLFKEWEYESRSWVIFVKFVHTCMF